MRSSGFITICYFLALAISARSLCSAASHASIESDQPDVRVQYKFEETVTLHEPVIVHFAVHNSAREPVALTLGAQNTQYFEFSLTGPDGQIVQSYANPGGGINLLVIGSGKVEIGPGEDYELPLLMNQWFHFKAAGTYFLAIRLTTNIDAPGGSSISPPKETIRITIKPRDLARLEKVCADLAREVASAPNAESAQGPALRLSYIDDPVAIPYLARLFDYAKLTDNLSVAGLERIGTDDAVRVLLSALNSGVEDRVELSRWALTRMQERISDPHLKETVKHALTPKSNA
jgi:hypothetical protein